MTDVSVVIPLFGTHRGRETLPVVCASWLAQSVPCEVVVAVADGPVPALPAGVRVIPADVSPAAPGLLRNVAAARARGSWFYLADADVRPVGVDFLERAKRLAGAGALAQPWMYRLLSDALEVDDDALDVFGHEKRCLLLRDAAGRPVPHPDERFVYDGDDLMVPLPEEVLRAAPPEQLRWRAAFHWGSMLLRREVFDAVGGYYDGYRGWGCEDDDLLAKVRAVTSVVTAWRAEPALRCLHFEHDGPYESAEFAANRAVLAGRIAAGVDSMIRADAAAWGKDDK
ncbi:hypothetical protein Val02_88050 [Virgisporangium aliadipatigenens]|uniref:Galactosyltransferase C-terminal domain-containing protein n=1 Tax=Virgisporangium aliadipatigenens TaxID=741659 RepID=A0A8J3YU31_9ACTN|nr:galactosyltransferase-related protein [Virgisporangium aliadipatigenens]GIJ51919.1 hypothetical protein Val02_88050 [Virgisporangium aliadipatigenens]